MTPPTLPLPFERRVRYDDVALAHVRAGPGEFPGHAHPEVEVAVGFSRPSGVAVRGWSPRCCARCRAGRCACSRPTRSHPRSSTPGCSPHPRTSSAWPWPRGGRSRSPATEPLAGWIAGLGDVPGLDVDLDDTALHAWVRGNALS